MTYDVSSDDRDAVAMIGGWGKVGDGLLVAVCEEACSHCGGVDVKKLHMK